MTVPLDTSSASPERDTPTTEAFMLLMRSVPGAALVSISWSNGISRAVFVLRFHSVAGL